MKKVFLLIAAAVVVCAVLLASVVTSAFQQDEEVSGGSTTSCGPLINTAAGAGGAKTIADLGAGWETNAQTIVDVGAGRGIPVKGQVVAIATAAQESRLVNINYGDRDSVGLFQQRTSQGWGTVAQIMDPVYASNKFYDALARVPGWELMTVTGAAQRVQRSGFPLAYEQWAVMAEGIVTGGGSNPVAGAAAERACASPIPVAATGEVGAVITAGQRWLGVDYSWGGGTVSGPGRGFAQGANIIGFDCSSFVQNAYYNGAGIMLPRTTRAQYAAGNKITSKDQLQPGDLMYFGSGGSVAAISHVGMYLGGGSMIHAPSTGDVVKISNDVLTSNYWVSRYVGSTRPLSTPASSAQDAA